MASSSAIANPGASYSPGMGLIYVFNLIVGTGALTLPAAFSHAGWLVSLCIILILAFISYLTMTFVVESMAAANAILRSRRTKQLRKKEEADGGGNAAIDDPGSPTSSPTKSLLAGIKERRKSPTSSPHRHYQSIAQRDDDELEGETTSDRSPLLPTSSPGGAAIVIGQTVVTTNLADLIEDDDSSDENCDISETVEMGKLAGMFFNRFGTILFFICIAIYLYGDLAIYGAAVGKSLRDTACTYYPPDVPCNQTLNGTVPCWAGSDMTRDNAYRLFLSAFVVVIGSFGFFNVQKTMLLQILTSIVRWTAFIAMIVLACVRLATSPAEDLGHPPAVRIDGTPNLFGACVYSFMCHHSLPSLLTPIRPKRGLYRYLAADYVLIVGFYLLLGLTGAFAFPHVADLYTLNFVPDRCPPAHSLSNVTAPAFYSNPSVIFLSGLPEEAVQIFQKILFYFLSLFPVFTLSTSFPIITITLRNNLKQLFLRRPESEYNFVVRRLLFPLLALIPPAVVAVVTSDVGFLVGFTGSYAGAAVQYVVPALLALQARVELAKEFSPPTNEEDPSRRTIRNAFASPFRHQAYVWLTLVWATACVAFVTYNHVMSH